MLVQVRLEGETLVAAFTFEILESRMCLHVGSEIGSVGERFTTVSTPVRLVTRMRPHVALQEPRSGECFPTDIAFVIEVVGQNVHGKCGHGNVALSTNMTFLGISRIQATVGLLVSGQVGAGGVVFSTF